MNLKILSITPLLIAISAFFRIAEADLSAGAHPGEVDLSFDAGSGFNGPIRDVISSGDGWIVTGDFTTVPGALRNGVTRLLANGETDLSFMEGLSGPEGGGVITAAVQEDGKLLLGGWFTTVNGRDRRSIARLHPDGSLDKQFNPVQGLIAEGTVEAIVSLSDGTIVIGGRFSFEPGGVRKGVARLTSEGSLDSSFQPSVLEGGSFPTGARTLAVEADGSVLVAGSFSMINGHSRQGFARLLPDGSVDASFDVDVGNRAVSSVAVAADGRIVIGGWFLSVNGEEQVRLARLHPDGTLDPSMASVPASSVRRIKLQSDGKILIAARFYSEHSDRIARLHTDGTMDEEFTGGATGVTGLVRGMALNDQGHLLIGGSFGSFAGQPRNLLALLDDDGNLIPDFYPGRLGLSGVVTTAAVQSDGTILVGGSFTRVHGKPHSLIARLLPDGSLDESFTSTFGGESGSVSAIAMAGEDILLAGSLPTPEGGQTHRVMRLKPDGSHDPAFNPTGGAFSRIPLTMAVQPDGRILLGGNFTSAYGLTRNRVARLAGDGSLDLTFLNEPAGTNRMVTQVAVQRDSRILLAGDFGSVNLQSRQGIARFHENGVLDIPFGDGLPGVTARHIAVQNDGKILLAGAFTTARGEPRGGIARLHEDGTLDMTFGDGLSGANGPVTALALQSNGKILIGGNFTEVNDQPRMHIARLNSDGTLDETFAPGLPGTDGPVEFFVLQDDGRIIVGGNFRSINGVARSRIARLHGDPPENRAPTKMALSHESVSEEAPAGTAVGDFSASDPDPEDTHTFSLVPGFGDAGNDSFAIEGSTLKTAALLNHQKQPGCSIRVRATDAEGLWVERTFTISVERDPHAPPPPPDPVDFHLCSLTVYENQGAGTVVGGFKASGPEEILPLTFALAEGEGDADNGLFAVTEDALVTAAVFDFDVQPSFSVRIRATGRDGSSLEKIFPIEVLPTPGPGTPDSTFLTASAINHAVHDIARQSDGKWIIGGFFTTVNGAARGRVARMHADGTVDESFLKGHSGANDAVFAVAVQDDGKVLIGGSFTAVNGKSRSRIARLNTDGSLDESFAAGLDGTNGTVRAIVVQTDGKILIGGEFGKVHGQVAPSIARLNEDGSIDTEFGPALSVNGAIHTIARQPDGRILIGGAFTRINGEPLNRIARLNPDGTVDWAFGEGLAGANLDVYRITLQADGRILVAGDFTQINGRSGRGIARLETDGAPDRTFLGRTQSGLRAVAVQDDGKILIAGLHGQSHRFYPDGTLDSEYENELPDRGTHAFYAIAPDANGTIIVAGGKSTFGLFARFHADGSLDEAFAHAEPGTDGSVSALVEQADGKLVVGGAFHRIVGTPANHLARLLPDGSADPDFSTAAILPFSGGIGALAIQEDGKILIGGRFRLSGAVSDSHLARLLPDGTLDETFSAAPDGAVRSIAIQPDGRILVAGNFSSISGVPRGRVARLHANGTLDNSLADGLAGPNFNVSDITLQPDGKILIGGSFTFVHGQPRNRIARLNTNGTLDSFGSGLGGTNADVRVIALQEDGKVLMGGQFSTVHGQPRGRIARLNSDGTLDSNFGHRMDGANSTIETIAIQPDGRIVIGGGFREFNGAARNRLARLEPNGEVDGAFGRDLDGADGWIVASLVQNNGRILLGGWFSLVNGMAADRIARLYGDPPHQPSSAPQDILLSRASVSQHQPVGTVVGEFSALDPDEDETHVYEFIAGDGDEGNSFFTISGNTLKTTEVLDHSERSSYSIRVKATNSQGFFAREVFVITVDPNRPPLDIELSHDTVSENRSPGTVVGTFSAIDPDENDTHTFTLTEGEGAGGNASFSIAGNTLRTAATFQYEQQSSYSIRVRATDQGGLFVEEVFVITVLPNQPPTDILLNNDTILENRPAGTLVGILAAVDPDEEDAHVFTLLHSRDRDEEYFDINGDRLVSATEFDYEVRNSYTIAIRATDQGGLSVEKEFIITIERDPFRLWAEDLPDGERGEGDDPGDLGIPNLLRYAFNMDPKEPETEKLPRIGTRTVTLRGGNEITYLTITYIRRTDDTLLSYFVEGSNDLTAWSELLRPTMQISADDGNGTTEMVTVRDTVSLDSREKRFLRVRVER